MWVQNGITTKCEAVVTELLLCPVLCQVDGEGRSWRSGARVERRLLRQWFLGITAYADVCVASFSFLLSKLSSLSSFTCTCICIYNILYNYAYTNVLSFSLIAVPPFDSSLALPPRQRLDRGLDNVKWPATVVDLQRRWIGRSKGATVTFLLSTGGSALEVFTTRPDTLFGVSYLAVGADSPVLHSLPGNTWENIGE